MWWWMLWACGTTVDTEPTDTDVCVDSLAPGEVEVFASGFEVDGVSGTEGIAFSPDGRLFVGGSGIQGGGFVAEIQPDGSWEILADVPGSVGLAWYQDQLVVAAGDVGDEGGVVAVSDDGTTTVLASGIVGANFPVVTPWDTLLVSAPGQDTIVEVDGDVVTPWLTDVPSPNGLAFTDDGSQLYLANTYDAPSDVGVVPVSDGVAGAYGVLATLDDGSTQDGVAMDAAGDLYVVLNLPGEIVRITPDGEVTRVASGVDYGASIAFGTGEGFDPCSIYATSLFTDAVFRVGTGREGRGW